MRGGNRQLYIVAGGGGFLGSHLCDALLATGAQVVCLDNFSTGRRTNLRHLERESRFDVIDADVVRPLPGRLKRLTITAVFNLACPASPVHYQSNPEQTLLTCVTGTRNLLVLAEQAKARFLLASTSEVYGDPQVHPQAEGYFGHVNPVGPRACYDEGKRAAEALCVDYARAGRVDTRIARIFNTYGPRMRPDDGRVVSNVIVQALAGEDITIYGDGCQTRSFCYVDDMIEGLLRLMDHPGPLPGPVNLGNPAELTINELVGKVVELTGTSAATTVRPLPADDPRRRRPDITLAKAELDWAPKTVLEDGLKVTIAWFLSESARLRDLPERRPQLAGTFSA